MTAPILLLRPAEAWKALGVGKSTFWRLVKSGQLRRVRLGGCTRFRLSEVERLVARSVR